MFDAVTEKQLFVEYRTTKDQKLREKLIESCLKLVFSLARKYWMDRNTETLQCLISAGNVGLVEAVEKFDPERGARFASYASFWILMHVRTELTVLHDTVMPSAKERKLRMRSAASRKRLGLDTKESGRNIYTRLDTGAAMDSAAGSEVPGHIIIHCPPDGEIGQQDAQRLFGRWFRFLTVREQFILRAYYGLLGSGDGLKLRQIASHLSLSSERVRQVKSSALHKLKRWLSYDGIYGADDVL